MIELMVGGEIILTLENGQGPAGPSTVAAQAAAAQAQAFATSAAASATTAAGHVATTAANAAAALASEQQAQASAMASANSAASSSASASNSNASQVSAAASAATATIQAALAVQSVASGAKPYATFAVANADLANIATGQIIKVVTDETRGGVMSLYQDNGTALVFLRNPEFYNSPVSYVQSDSINNMITKLLVLTGVIPQAIPVINADFADPTY